MGRTTLLMATACGLIVANLYYAQMLLGDIGRQLNMAPESTGLIVTLTQLGYGCGLLLLVPLADLVENRRLTVTLTLACAFALTLLGLAPSATLMLVASFLVGLASTAIQVIVPLAAHLAPEERRGRVVGNVMSGLMAGIMLSRPAAGAVANLAGWESVYWLSAALMLATAVLLAKKLPKRQPEGGVSYLSLLASLGSLYARTPVLRQRGLYQAFMFGAFSVYWTAVPLYLASPAVAMSAANIAWFSLAGVAGVVAAPLAGTLADRGQLRLVTVGSMLVVCLSFLISPLGKGDSAIAYLLLAGIGIDFGVTANLIVSQREVFSLDPESRSRLNGLFISTFFLGGAAGSALGGWAIGTGGWERTWHAGAALPCLALILFLTLEWLKSRRDRSTNRK